MPQSTDIEKDPFLVLLTDALRAGPGSPEWRDAVAKLKASGEDVDEYRLLIEAREALESGKDYRSVRAGPGFTRKLMTNIEEEPPATNRRPFPIAGFIAAIAGIVVLGTIALAVYKLYPRNPVSPATRSDIDDLQATYFPNQVLSATFDAGVPAGWRTIGSLPVVADKGVRPGDAAVPEGDYVGGGIVVTDPLPAGQPFSAQVTLAVKSTGDALIPQVFVSNSPDFSRDRATGQQQELVWQIQGKEQKVVVGGRVEKQSPLPAHAQTLSVRLILNKDLAIVESNGARLWAGPNGLGDQPRYVGVRFVRTAGKSTGDIVVQSVGVQKS